MRVLIESFVVLLTFSILLIQCLYILRKTFKSNMAFDFEKLYHFSYLFAVSLLLASQYRLLMAIYKKKIYDYENGLLIGQLKILQFFSENIFKSVFVCSINIILNLLELMKVAGIKDNRIIQYSIFLYSILRSFPIGILIFTFSEAVAFNIFVVETFLLSENVVFAILLFVLHQVIFIIKKEVSQSIHPEKPYIQYQLRFLLQISQGFIVSLVLESISKIVFVFVMIESQTKFLVFLKDIANLFKIISIFIIITSMNRLIFNDIDETNLMHTKKSFNSNKEFKFFIFDEESSEVGPEIK